MVHLKQHKQRYGILQQNKQLTRKSEKLNNIAVKQRQTHTEQMDYETTNSSLFYTVTQVSTRHICATFLSHSQKRAVASS